MNTLTGNLVVPFTLVDSEGKHHLLDDYKGDGCSWFFTVIWADCLAGRTSRSYGRKRNCSGDGTSGSPW